MKREYFIAHRGKDNEWSIFRKDEDGDIVQWLSWELVWTKEKGYAKKFLHRQSVESALSIIKSKWELKTDEEYIEGIIENSKSKEKRTWSEL
jgi:hypothetical protein